MDPSGPTDDGGTSRPSVTGETPLSASPQVLDDRSIEAIAITAGPSGSGLGDPVPNGREMEHDSAAAGEPAQMPAAEDPGAASADPADGNDAPREATVAAMIDATEPALPQQQAPLRQLHPLPRGLVELYGLLAVLFVLVPEWMAGGALFGFREGRQGTDLPAPSGAWKRLPELRLASLTLGELRLLARQMGVRGYGRLSREPLTTTLLRRLTARR